MTWGFVAVAGATVISGAMSSNAQSKAADKQAKAAQSELELKRQMFDEQMAMGAPYRQFGEQYLPMLGDAMQPINREAELAAYYQSPEFSMMSDVARNQQLAASEATGGLGATSTGNALASIAPQLGQNYLAMREGQQADLFNRLLGGVNIGLSGAGMQQQAAGQFGSQAGDVMSRNAAQQAMASLGQAQTWSNTMGNLSGLAFNYFNQPTTGGV